MPTFATSYTAWAVSLGIGLLIGAERERRKGEGPHRAPAGIRTFAVTALLGTAAMSLGGAPLLGILAAGLMGLLLIGYARDAKQDPGLTTELALVATLLLGALAVSRAATAAGMGVVVAGLLASRAPLHRFVREVLSEAELQSALIFCAATLVIWPVIPDRYLGPFDALNPRTMWTVVILTMGISAGGYIARRALGARLGLPIAGLASGFISASATVAAMGGRARQEPHLLAPAVAAAVLSTVATIAQMTLLLAATSRPTLVAFAPSLTLAGATSLAYALFFSGRLRGRPPAPADAPGSAFSLAVALTLAGTLGLVLVAVAALRAWLGDAGLVAASGLAGFADTHAAAVSVASQVAHDRLTAADARVPILVALTTNSITKVVLAVASGCRPFAWRVIPGLMAVLVAAWAGLLVGGR